tara:strand:+ start:3178 stop:3312 length:135 start_codon:yes stop_codon:yes gene_type:complete
MWKAMPGKIAWIKVVWPVVHALLAKSIDMRLLNKRFTHMQWFGL